MKLVKSILLAGAATVVAAGAAVAADPIMPAPISPVAPIVTAYDWSGFYAGVNAGYGWGEAYSAAAGGVIALGGVTLNQINGLLGGAQIGFNAQHDAIVFGVEADIQASGLSQSVGAGSVGLDYLGTVRGRLGVDVGNGILPYLTAGFAYGQGRVAPPAPAAAETQFHTGWTVGGGVEFKLDQQVSLKGEYLYYDLGERAYPATLGGANAGLRGHTIRAGVNFHF